MNRHDPLRMAKERAQRLNSRTMQLMTLYDHYRQDDKYLFKLIEVTPVGCMILFSDGLAMTLLNHSSEIFGWVSRTCRRIAEWELANGKTYNHALDDEGEYKGFKILVTPTGDRLWKWEIPELTIDGVAYGKQEAQSVAQSKVNALLRDREFLTEYAGSRPQDSGLPAGGYNQWNE